MDANARASEDLALLWGANANATQAAFWIIYSVLRDSRVLQRFCQDIAKAELTRSGDDFAVYDVDILCSSPFLQSVYAETLRLYVANIVLRSPRTADMPMEDWVVRRGEIIAVMSYPMHHDETKFSVGTSQDPHPLSEFWAERLLITSNLDGEMKDEDLCKFSLAGSDGAWLPYGGESNECPGRFFAKQEMLLTAALMIGNSNYRETQQR